MRIYDLLKEWSNIELELESLKVGKPIIEELNAYVSLLFKYPSLYINNGNIIIHEGLVFVKSLCLPFYEILGYHSSSISYNSLASLYNISETELINRCKQACKIIPLVINPRVTDSKFIKDNSNVLEEYCIKKESYDSLGSYLTAMSKKNRYKVKKVLDSYKGYSVALSTYDEKLRLKAIELISRRFDDNHDEVNYINVGEVNQVFALYQAYIPNVVNSLTYTVNNSNGELIGLVSFEIYDNIAYFMLNANNINYPGLIQYIILKATEDLFNNHGIDTVMLSASSFGLEEGDRCYDYKKVLATDIIPIYSIRFNDKQGIYYNPFNDSFESNSSETSE